jgi:cellulose synthase/poly-beta-1,6-N-acetylglucosamine synthase-like glycosyltransferase
VSTALDIVFVALLGYFLSLNSLYLGLSVAALIQLHRESGRRYIDYDPLTNSAANLPVSIIMPAYNESVVLRDTVSAMLASNYREFEVIVVNDGSTDDTVQIAAEAFALEPHDVFHPAPVPSARVRGTYRSRLYPNLWLIDKENGGAADALNAGLNLARYPLVAHVDSDCMVEPDAVARLMRPINFDPEEVQVVGATLRLTNGLQVRGGRIMGEALPRRLVERFQAIEYLSAFVLNRLGWGALNSVPVISGGGGVWPKQLLIEMGGFSTEDTHYDIEATIHAHALLASRGSRYRIFNVPDATVWTQVPATWRDLKIQRKRWQRVVYEMLWKYRQLIFNPRYGYFGMLGMPYLLVFEGLGPFVEVFAYGFVIALACLGMLSAGALALFLCFSFGLTAVVRVLSILADILYFRVYPRRNLVVLAGLAFVEQPTYHVAQLPCRIAAMFEFLRGQRTHETMARTAIASDAPGWAETVRS